MLVKLADKLPDNWNVNLIGDGTKSQIEKFQYLYSKMKYPSKINYLGPKNSDELAAYYKNSRILVSPALYEGFGLTLVEAMNFGLPVVTFETTGAMEITQNGKFGYLVKDFSENNFIKGTIDLINNEKILAEYTELALLRSNTFSLNSILQQWEELLKYVTS
nr:glycosyltransferase [Enterococcus faecium]